MNAANPQYNTTSAHFVTRQCCPGCGSKQTKAIVTIPYSNKVMQDYLQPFYESRGAYDASLLNDADYCLHECQDCTLIFQQQIPNDALLTIIYTQWINNDKQAALRKTISRRAYGLYTQEIALLIKMFGSNTIKSFDFGMGWSQWATLAAGAGFDSYGSEVDDFLCDNAAAKGVKPIKPADLANYQEYFDYVHTEQVMEHLADPGKDLAMLIAVLKPGGIIKISVPFTKHGSFKRSIVSAAQQKAFDFKKLHNPAVPLQHLNTFNNKAILAFGKSHGLSHFKPSFADFLSTRQVVYPDNLVATFIRPFYMHFIFNYGTSVYLQKPKA